MDESRDKQKNNSQTFNFTKRIQKANKTKTMNINLLLKWGEIEFDELSSLDKNPIKSIDSLKEDMLQVKFTNNYLLDVGWYPSFDLNGKFRVFIVRDYDWEHPIYSGTAKDIVTLRREIEQSLKEMQLDRSSRSRRV